MIDLDDFFNKPCYQTPQQEKDVMLLSALNKLNAKHYSSCSEYRRINDAYGEFNKDVSELDEIPFLPVRLFKELELKSIQEKDIFKTLMSSGTTGQSPSRIFLDSETAKLQTKTLIKIVQTFIGKQRLPMLIVDHPSVVKNRESFSARGAGILGLYNFGRNHTYVLSDEDMGIDLAALQSFAEKYKGMPILIFGFTFMIWKYFISELEKTKTSIDLSSACLIHSGGWKKLEDDAVDNEEFKSRLKNVTGISKVHNFYGMVEQVGTIFMECEKSYLHAPIFSDVIIRNPEDWSVCEIGQPGVIQVVSVLPLSYPGHSLMTEDKGVLVGEDDCKCGRQGRYFRVLGRLPKAEVRGCSDTHNQIATNVVSAPV